MATYGIPTFTTPGAQPASVTAVTEESPFPVQIITVEDEDTGEEETPEFEAPTLLSEQQETNRLLRKLIAGLEWRWETEFPDTD